VRKKKQVTKKVCERRHAAARAALRFGIKWDRHRLREFKLCLVEGELPLLKKQSLRVSVYRHTVDGVEVAAVYDKKRKEVVTFLPLDWMEQENEDQHYD